MTHSQAIAIVTALVGINVVLIGISISLYRIANALEGMINPATAPRQRTFSSGLPD